MIKLKIAIASDHRGVELKKELLAYLLSKGYEVKDCSEVNTPDDDYPDFVVQVCQSILKKESDLGILICRTGIGMSIAANKIKGIYCGRVVNENEAQLAREDNGVNVITIDSWEGMTPELAKKIIETFINTPPLSHDRHLRRFNKIIKIENGAYNDL